MRLTRAVSLSTIIGLAASLVIATPAANATQAAQVSIADMQNAFDLGIEKTAGYFENSSGTFTWEGCCQTIDGTESFPLVVQVSQDAASVTLGSEYYYLSRMGGVVSLDNIAGFDKSQAKRIFKEAKVSATTTAAEFTWGDGGETFLKEIDTAWLLDALRQSAVFAVREGGSQLVTLSLGTALDGGTVTRESVPSGGERWLFEGTTNVFEQIVLGAVEFTTDSTGAVTNITNGFYTLDRQEVYGQISMTFTNLGSTVPQPKENLNLASLKAVGAATWRINAVDTMKVTSDQVVKDVIVTKPSTRKIAVKAVQGFMKKNKAAGWKYSAIAAGGAYRAQDPTGKMVEYTIRVTGKDSQPKLVAKRTK